MAKRFFYVCAGLLCLALTYHLGARSATAQAPGPEIAVLSGTIGNGEVIPLPLYADGSTALESECDWIVSPSAGESGCYSIGINCYTTGRVVTVDLWGSCGYAFEERANYVIIARRGAVPTSGDAGSLGSLKARYRGEREPLVVSPVTGR